MEANHNTQALRERRRELRKSQTVAEKKIWFHLRNTNLGVKFKRQESIGGYIADFYCSKYKLIIEIDGGIHNNREQKVYDKLRDEYYKSLDYKVLRFSNLEVKNNIEKVLGEIKSNLILR